MANRNPNTKRGVHATKVNLQREAAPRAARNLILVISALVVSLLLWASQTELQELARADGEIAPTGELRRVDHFDGGVVRVISVRAGEAVHAGQVLARLEQPGLAADSREVAQRLMEVSADIARVTELLRDAEAVTRGDALEGLSQLGTNKNETGSDSGYAQTQHNLFLARQAMLAERVKHRRAGVRAAQGLQANAFKRVSLSDRALLRFQHLLDRGVASEAQFLEQTEETETVRSDLLSAEVELARARNEFSGRGRVFRSCACLPRTTPRTAAWIRARRTSVACSSRRFCSANRAVGIDCAGSGHRAISRRQHHR